MFKSYPRFEPTSRPPGVPAACAFVADVVFCWITHQRSSQEGIAKGLARLLRTTEAAIYVGLSPRTMEKHRTYGTGPVYRKLGNRVVYAIEDLDAWAAQGIRRSTSDPGVGTVYPAKRITAGS